MPQFLGEYECKVDAKLRMRLPSLLLKQLNPEEKLRFVINRGFEKCLTLYPIKEWQKITEEIQKLNQFDPNDRKFTRYFYRGATELEADSNDRILLPKRLKEYANIEKEVVIFAYQDRIELWSKEQYDMMFDDEPEDFSDLAAKVMTKMKNNTEE